VAHPPERLLLKVLADLGGSEQAPSVGRILLDSRQPWLVRQEAAFALAAIADPPALSWLDRFATLRRMAKKISEGDDEPPSLGAAADQRDTTADLEAASIRDAIRRHLAWFGSGEGPTAVCPLGSSWPETFDQAREDECLSIRIEEVDAVEGAREIADRLPLEEEDRRYVVTFEPGWRAAKSLYRVRPIGDRWLVRSVWHWVS
jgi:hypothetical protein